jgi:hypothetical protein
MLVLKDIVGYSRYKAGEDGEIYSLCSGVARKLKKSKRTPKSYFHVNIKADGTLRFKTRDIHPLICEAFFGPRPSGYDCSHVNGNRWDNRPENLCWESRASNFARKKVHGTHDQGCNNSRAKLNREQIRQMKHYLREGEKHDTIAKEFNVSRLFVTKVANGHRYANEGSL